MATTTRCDPCHGKTLFSAFFGGDVARSGAVASMCDVLGGAWVASACIADGPWEGSCLQWFFGCLHGNGWGKRHHHSTPSTLLATIMGFLAAASICVLAGLMYAHSEGLYDECVPEAVGSWLTAHMKCIGVVDQTSCEANSSLGCA